MRETQGMCNSKRCLEFRTRYHLRLKERCLGLLEKVGRGAEASYGEVAGKVR